MNKKILAVHFKFHESDGVSIIANENHRVLRKMGYDVRECSMDAVGGLKLQELDYNSLENNDIRNKIFQGNSGDQYEAGDEEKLILELRTKASEIQKKVEEYIDREQIAMIHIHNLFSLPLHIASTLAFYEIIKARTSIRAILHHHDFWWMGERINIFKTRYKKIMSLLEEMFPHPFGNAVHIRHLVINSLDRDELRKRKNIQADILTDCLDFNAVTVTSPEHSEFRNRFGIGEDDLVAGVMTRITPRKAIEFAIQFIADLSKKRGELENISGGIGPKARKFNKNSRIILLLPQNLTNNAYQTYLDTLYQYGEKLGVEIKHIADSIVADSKYDGGNMMYAEKFPFFSTYDHIDLFLYPTIQEGFGNQLLEAVWKNFIPIMFEYPVYLKDISPVIKHIISLGKSREDFEENLQNKVKVLKPELVNLAVAKTIEMLTSPDDSKRKTKENFDAAYRVYDTEAVTKKLVTYLSPTT